MMWDNFVCAGALVAVAITGVDSFMGPCNAHGNLSISHGANTLQDAAYMVDGPPTPTDLIGTVECKGAFWGLGEEYLWCMQLFENVAESLPEGEVTRAIIDRHMYGLGSSRLQQEIGPTNWWIHMAANKCFVNDFSHEFGTVTSPASEEGAACAHRVDADDLHPPCNESDCTSFTATWIPSNNTPSNVKEAQQWCCTDAAGQCSAPTSAQPRGVNWKPHCRITPGGNVFSSNGFLMVESSAVNIPLLRSGDPDDNPEHFARFQRVLKSYGAKLYRYDEPFGGWPVSMNYVSYNLKETLLTDWATQATEILDPNTGEPYEPPEYSWGPAFFLEYHRFPHYYTNPVRNHRGAPNNGIVLGRVSTQQDGGRFHKNSSNALPYTSPTKEAVFEVTAFKIPYGYTLEVPAGTLHCDWTYSGTYGFSVVDLDQHPGFPANTVFWRAPPKSGNAQDDVEYVDIRLIPSEHPEYYDIAPQVIGHCESGIEECDHTFPSWTMSTTTAATTTAATTTTTTNNNNINTIGQAPSGAPSLRRRTTADPVGTTARSLSLDNY